MKKALTIRIFLIILLFTFTSCKRSENTDNLPTTDVVLIGGGIMSASVGSLLHELAPKLDIEIFERLGSLALESSKAWNNAGTGHAAYCELNYTPEQDDGSININKAIEINKTFELSKQFWAYQVEQGGLSNPQSFINNVPHMSFVTGKDNVAFLKRRFLAMKDHPLFNGMQYSEDSGKIKEWAPLLMAGRDESDVVAATRMDAGCDVNFGTLTESLFAGILRAENVSANLSHEVTDIKRHSDGTWLVSVTDLNTKNEKIIKSRFVFIGAGGAALPLLQKTKIPESKPFAGFPVGGEWLVTHKPELVEAHLAKVYGKASVGSPPMSVPHLDTRFIDGKKSLLFGPFAIFSTKFLVHGSWLDIMASFRMHNAWPMLQAGWRNIPITRYLISQVLLSKEGKVETLKRYFPDAKSEDWHSQKAGQRVQIIKNDPLKGGVLQFGTEVISSADGSLVALLGASPGASIAVDVALKVMEKGFKSQMQDASWQQKLKQMVPSYNASLVDDPALLKLVRERNKKYLGIKQ